MARKQRSSSSEHYEAWMTLQHLQKPAATGQSLPENNRSVAAGQPPEEPHDTIITLQHLPLRPILHKGPTGKPFAINIAYILLHPQSLRSISSRTGKPTVYFNTRTAHISCQQYSIAYVPTSHSWKAVVNDLFTTAAATFGLGGLIDIKERKRWGYTLVAGCAGHESSVNDENGDFVLHASKQGGWSWRLYIVEVEREADGRWESAR